MKPLLCLRHQPSAPLGIVADVLAERGVPWRYVDLWRQPPPADADGCAGVVVLGGAMNADADGAYPWLAPTRRLLAAAVVADVPVLGICLGAQLLARALGAAVGPSPVREVGFRPVRATAAGRSDPVLAPFAPSALVFQFHEDACALPAGAQLLFTGDDVGVQAFRVGLAWGVQFHFEVTARIVADWCDEVPPHVLRDVWGTTREAVLADAREHLASQQRAGRQAAGRFLGVVADGAG